VAGPAAPPDPPLRVEPEDEREEGAPGPADEARRAPAPPKARPVHIDESRVVSNAGTLKVMEAVKQAIAASNSSGGSFKVVALQSGYAAELSPLSFQDIARLQSSALDPFTQRNRLLETLHGHITKFSCQPMDFQSWKRRTAQGDYDTLMYGLYAATYPGDNEFEVGCKHCGHLNKLVVDVNHLVRAIKREEVFDKIKQVLEPAFGDYAGPIVDSLVGRAVQVELPQSGIVAEVRNPSLEDQMIGAQYFNSIIDHKTGAPPDRLAGIEKIRTLVMYTGRMLIPAGGGAYVGMSDADQKTALIGKLTQRDGEALSRAVEAEAERLLVEYEIPPFPCGACSKRNDKLALDFTQLLFIKLQESA
jgi:hypothetical protein